MAFIRSTMLAVLLVSCSMASAADPTEDVMSLVAAVGSSPAGQTYGRWAAAWWQWALGVPGATNPLADTTGASCAQRQTDSVWFLAGAFSADPVVRTCTIPADKSLFFPLINSFFGAFLDDPAAQRTDDFVRAAARCGVPAQISVQVDGVTIPKPTRFFTGPMGSPSPTFNVQLPPGNVFGLDETALRELVLSPSAEEGYYLFLRPLSAGAHVIHWTASGCMPGAAQDVTYLLTVLGAPR